MKIYKDTIADQLGTVVTRRCDQYRTPQVIRIIGLPACGKSSLAAAVAKTLQAKDIKAEVFEDTFEIALSRQERFARALSGIDYESYDLTGLAENLRLLLEGTSVEVQPYSHDGGKSTASPHHLQPADVLILDGFVWQHPIFDTLLDSQTCFTVSLMPADFEMWRALSLERDTRVRGYTTEQAAQEFADKQSAFLEHATDLLSERLDTYFMVRGRDLSRSDGDRYIYEVGDKRRWPHLDLEEAQRRQLFVAYQFQDQDLVSGLLTTLRENGFIIQTGSLIPGSIAIGIINRIRRAAAFVAVLTKRDALAEGGFTSSSWLLEEKGAAIMANKPILLMVEEGVNQHYIGYLQSDVQWISFNRNSFASKSWELVAMLKKLMSGHDD